jgi:hypothetical protein
MHVGKSFKGPSSIIRTQGRRHGFFQRPAHPSSLPQQGKGKKRKEKKKFQGIISEEEQKKRTHKRCERAEERERDEDQKWNRIDQQKKVDGGQSQNDTTQA